MAPTFHLIKVKIKLSLCLTKHHAMKAYWEWRYNSTHSLTSALGGGGWSASRPGRLTLRGRDPGTHWTGGWVGPRTVLDAVGKRKIPSPRRKSNPRTPIVQPVAHRYTDWAITDLYVSPNIIFKWFFHRSSLQNRLLWYKTTNNSRVTRNLAHTFQTSNVLFSKTKFLNNIYKIQWGDVNTET
jgi:hypothetical protein